MKATGVGAPLISFRFSGQMASGEQKSTQEGKRKDRGSSGSISSSSPEDKRIRNNSSTSSEDVVMDALKAVDGFSDQISQILSKLEDLNKLDGIVTKLNSIEQKITALEGTVSHIQDKQKEIELDVKELTRNAVFLSDEVDQIKENQHKSVNTINSDLAALQKQLLYQNCYSRRENLNFFGIEEDPGENTEEKVRIFLTTVLELREVENIEFQRIHRSGGSRTRTPRPIIARFLRYSDRERVIRQGFIKLKGTSFRVLEDFPKEIIESRRKLLPKLKQAKADGKRAYFSRPMPDRLIVDGKMMDV